MRFCMKKDEPGIVSVKALIVAKHQAKPLMCALRASLKGTAGPHTLALYDDRYQHIPLPTS